MSTEFDAALKEVDAYVRDALTATNDIQKGSIQHAASVVAASILISARLLAFAIRDHSPEKEQDHDHRPTPP